MKYSWKLLKTDDWSHNPAIKSGHQRDLGKIRKRGGGCGLVIEGLCWCCVQVQTLHSNELSTLPGGGSPHQYMCSSHPHSSVGETNQNIQEEYFNLAYYLHFTFYFQMQTVYHPHATIAATIQISIWSTYLQLHISCTQHTTFALERWHHKLKISVHPCDKSDNWTLTRKMYEMNS